MFNGFHWHLLIMSSVRPEELSICMIMYVERTLGLTICIESHVPASKVMRGGRRYTITPPPPPPPTSTQGEGENRIYGVSIAAFPQRPQ